MKITSGLLLQARDYLYQVITDENLKFGAKFNSIDPDSITPFLQSLEIVSKSLKFERTNYKDINPTELTTVIFTKFIYFLIRQNKTFVRNYFDIKKICITYI